MSKLIAVISPAKLLQENVHYPNLLASEASFLPEAQDLVSKLKKKSAKDLSKMMDLSPALGAQNQVRYAEWHLPFTVENSVQALLMFRGEVYRGMNADDFTKKEYAFAQEHLRILSGLYGLLKPMDLIQGYRLMMGTPFSPDKNTKNLYAFWGDKIANLLAADLDKKGVIVNLASEEYFKSVSLSALNRRVIHCDFKEKKGDKYTIVSTYAKLARGYMARFIIKNAITKPEDIQSFGSEGYIYAPKLSSDDRWVFTRG